MLKRILLSSAILDVKDMFGQYSAGGGAYLPHGLLSMAAMLLKHGYEVSICDPYAMGMDEGSYRRYLMDNNFHIIGLGNCYTSQTSNYYRTAEICREVLPKARICIGGVHPTLYAKEMLEECSQIDFAIKGEGEFSFLRLVEALDSSGIDISRVGGLVFRAADGIRVNEPSCSVTDIDGIPAFPYHLLQMDKYVPPPSNYKRLPTYSMIVQRGCPYSCVYCDSRIHGRRLRQMSVEKAIDEITLLQDHYAMKGIIFQDSIFTANRAWVMDFCRALLKKEIDIKWSCYTRCDNVDEDLCKLMKESGCWNISLGIESANQSSLDLIKKNITVDKIVSGIRAVRTAGIEVTGSVIICLPGEDEEMVKNTIRFTKEMDLDYTVFFMPVPFPGTELYDMCKDDGGLPKDIGWPRYKQWMDQRDPIYINPKLGKKKMISLYEYAFRSFYLSPRFILKSLKKIRNVEDFRKYFKGFRSIKGLLGMPVKSQFLSLRD